MPTREIYWNIAYGKLVYLFFLIVVGVLAYSLYTHYQRWRLGKKEEENRFDQIGQRLKDLLTQAFAQRRIVSQKYPGLMHLFIFSGFLVLFIGTSMIAVQENLSIEYLYGSFYLVYSLILDLFGVLALVGIGMAVYRRVVVKPDRLNNVFDDVTTLSLFVLVLVTGYLVEGPRIAATELQTHPEWSWWSPAGLVFAKMFSGLTEGTLRTMHKIFWWGHMFLAFAFLGYFGYSKLSHIFFSPLNIFLRSSRPRGALKPITDFETAETFGAGNIRDLTWKQLLDGDACTSCGRCQDACPAYMSGKPLSPKKLILDIRDRLASDGPLLLQQKAQQRNGTNGQGENMEEPSTIGALIGVEGGYITEDVLWSCTTCRACMEECPVLIEHIDEIVDMRRYLVLTEARLPETAEQALRSLETRGHPWRGTTFSRTSWTEGLNIPELAEVKEVDVLFWVGCTGALVDRNIQITIALAKILQQAGVSFAILGEEETCTGDPARRLGNEYLFQMLAQQNIETLNKYKFKKVVTHCPHCFNTLKNEYPQFGGNYEVVHHSELLDELIKTGKLKLTKPLTGKVTYHDSCYLGRHNGIYDAPRNILQAIPGSQVLEMKRSRERGLCCGAGGGHAWMEVRIGRSVNHIRTEEVMETGAETVSTACPFCMQMFEDGIRAKQQESSITALDIAEIVERSL